MKDIPGYDTFTKIEPINKGWSEDKKYCVTDNDGAKYLLRITPISRYAVRKALFEMLEQVSALDIPMCRPIEFGTCDDGVYSLHSWIDGEDLEAVLPLLSETQQYVLGLQSGEILRKIHSIPAPDTHEDWAIRFNRKTNYKIQKYRECGIRFDGDEKVIAYIEENRHLLDNRPQTLQHGDYSVSNMMYADGKVFVIDFSVDYGDPWQDFESIRWSVDKSTHFATGTINGYFSNNVPNEFWVLLKLYLAEGCFHNLVWSINTGVQEQVDTTLRQISDVKNWFDNMNNPVPSWYQQSIELMDIYDAHRNKTGRHWIRGSRRDKDEYILIAAALLRRSDGRYLLTKRSPNKGDSNKWNIQGGASLAGEDSLSAAIRENAEECGIIPDASRAELFMSQMKDTAFIDIWLFRQEFSLDDIVLRDGETCDAMAATLDEIIALNSRGDFTNGTVIPAEELIEKIAEWEAAK